MSNEIADKAAELARLNAEIDACRAEQEEFVKNTKPGGWGRNGYLRKQVNEDNENIHRKMERPNTRKRTKSKQTKKVQEKKK